MSNTTASTSSASSDTGMSPSSASPTQNTVAVECRWWHAHHSPTHSLHLPNPLMYRLLPQLRALWERKKEKTYRWEWDWHEHVAVGHAHSVGLDPALHIVRSSLHHGALLSSLTSSLPPQSLFLCGGLVKLQELMVMQCFVLHWHRWNYLLQKQPSNFLLQAFCTNESFYFSKNSQRKKKTKKKSLGRCRRKTFFITKLSTWLVLWCTEDQH